MSEHIKDRTIRVADIPADAEVVLEQRSKPLLSALVLSGLGLLMICSPSTRLIGLIMIVLVWGLYALAKDQKLLGIYDQYIVSYDRSEETARIFYLDEIVRWEISQEGSRDVLLLYLNDGSMSSLPLLYSEPVRKALKKMMAEREDRPELRFAKDLANRTRRRKK